MNLRIFFCVCISVWSTELTFAQTGNNATLKAILIVGYQEDGTAQAMADMDKVAALFEQHSISVSRFYNDKANWNDIVRTAKDCNFLVYSGHGSVMGENGNAGGLCIKTMVSSERLISELKLKESALVLFQSVCNGAGSSAGDLKDIGIVEAKKRVTHYATPFFKVGAAAYVANNYTDGILHFLEDFLDGTSLKLAYENQTEPWSKAVFNHPFPGYPDKTYSIAADEGGGTAFYTTYVNGKKITKEIVSPKSYDVAYVGPAEFTLQDIRNAALHKEKANVRRLVKLSGN